MRLRNSILDTITLPIYFIDCGMTLSKLKGDYVIGWLIRFWCTSLYNALCAQL
jgi:hypothetical protein